MTTGTIGPMHALAGVAHFLCGFGNLGAALTPSDLGYWFGEDGLGLEYELFAFVATIVLILWKGPEMRDKPMVIAFVLSCLLVLGFLWVGAALPRVDADAACLLMTGAQFFVLTGLEIHRHFNTTSVL